MPDTTIEIQKKITFITAIENSVGTRIFNSLFVKHKDADEITDILHDGNFSCAFFVSGILSIFQLIQKPCSTVATLRETLEHHTDWKNINTDTIEAGDVVFWKKVTFEDGSQHAHVGFAIGTHEAISTSDIQKAVSRHQIMTEQIETVYRCTSL
jgi:hypothetical protein